MKAHTSVGNHRHPAVAFGLLLCAALLPGIAASAIHIEYGHVTLNHMPERLTFSQPFNNPVIISGPPTFHGPDPGVVDVTATATTARLRFSEWSYLNGGHADEQVPYAVIEQGRYALPDGSIWEAGTVKAFGAAEWLAKHYQAAFPGTPHLFLTIQTRNGEAPVTVRARAVTPSGFKVALFEEEALRLSGHVLETIGYLAVYQPAGSGAIDITGRPVPYVLQQAQVNHNWTRVAGIELKTEEERSLDDELFHALETIDVLRIDDVILAQDVSSRGVDTMALRQLRTGGGSGSGVDARLAELNFSSGALDQVFHPDRFEYTAEVGFWTTSTSLSLLPRDQTATVMVNGEPVQPGALSVDVELQEGLNTIAIDVTAADGALRTYIILITRQGAGQFAQQAYIKASNAQAYDRLGMTVALSGNTLAVSAIGEASAADGVNGDQSDNSASEAGAVYVFVRDNNGRWTQQAYLKASNSDAGDFFGRSLALSGNTLAVGAFGEASSARGIDGNQLDNSAARAGAVYVFTRNAAGVWNQQAYIKAANTRTDYDFGFSLDLDGDTLAVGSYFESSNAVGINGDPFNTAAFISGAAYVFQRNAEDEWQQQAYIKASNAEAGDRFGYSVAVSGNTLAVGSIFEASAARGIDGNQADNSAMGAGAVYVYTRNPSAVWSQQAYLKSPSTVEGEFFGWSVDLSGNTLAVGALEADSEGAVHVFVRDTGFWSQQAVIKAAHPQAGDYFGYEVSLSGSNLAVEAWGDNGPDSGINGDETDNSALGTGAVYLFRRSNGIWNQHYYVKASNPDDYDFFGTGIAVFGDTLAVGAQNESSSARSINGDQSDNSAPDAGAVYVFR